MNSEASIFTGDFVFVILFSFIYFMFSAFLIIAVVWITWYRAWLCILATSGTTSDKRVETCLLNGFTHVYLHLIHIPGLLQVRKVFHQLLVISITQDVSPSHLSFRCFNFSPVVLPSLILQAYRAFYKLRN